MLQPYAQYIKSVKDTKVFLYKLPRHISQDSMLVSFDVDGYILIFLMILT